MKDVIGTVEKIMREDYEVWLGEDQVAMYRRIYPVLRDDLAAHVIAVLEQRGLILAQDKSAEEA